MKITIETDLEGEHLEAGPLVFENVIDFAIVGTRCAAEGGKVMRIGDLPAINNFSHRMGDNFVLVEKLLGLIERIRVEYGRHFTH